MSIDIKVPVLPESVSSASVATWHKKPGDQLLRDERLVDIETDKVILEVVAPEDGVLEKIIQDTGATVSAQEVIGLFKAQKVETKKAAEAEPESEPEPEPEPKKQATTPAKAPASQSPKTDSKPSSESKPKSAPAAASTPVQKASAPASEIGPEVGSPSMRRRMMSNPVGDRVDRRVPMSRLRARIAERLVQAQQTAAILTTFNEINMQAVMDLRARYKDSFEKKHGVKLGFMSFFTLAVIAALKKFPEVNASIEGSDIIYHDYYDIAIAVSTQRGLVVPVIREAEKLSMAEIELKINELGEKAKNGQLSIDEITGGTFTISNGGVFGSLLSTPILNAPQTGILGMHKIEERPIVENGQIVIKPMMYVALSYDHRLIDGKDSVQFLAEIKNYLEDPARALLNI